MKHNKLSLAGSSLRFKTWLKQPHIITIRFRWVVIGILLINAYGRHGGQIIYADPISPVPQLLTQKIPKAVPLPQTALEPVPGAQTVYVAPVVQTPVYTAPTCVMGVTVGNYAENALIQRESGGNSCITNSIGCVGLLQACPGSKLYAACPTLGVDCQLSFFSTYMYSSYGSWENAWAQDEARYPHWW